MSNINISVRRLMAGVLAAAGFLVPALASAVPSAWPSTWIYIQSDPDEGGATNDHRDVAATFYNVREGYLFLRMQNRADAGWPSTASQGKARYKWFFDTANNDGVVQGGSVRDAEFMIMLEDLTLNASDPTLTRDQYGELTFLDAIPYARFQPRWDSTNPPHYTNNTPENAPSPSPYWRRLLGTGTAGTGGAQGVMGENVGYRITGRFVDMYVKLSVIGSPNSLPVLWLTDQQDTNLDQAPCCDRPDDEQFIDLDLTGDITIVKDAQPDDPQNFSFSGDLGSFTLDDANPDDSDGVANSVTFSNLDPGSFDVSEAVPAGWVLGNIICDGDTDGGSSVNLAAGTVSIDLDAKESIACTFVDTAEPTAGGTITIVKDSIPDDTQDFDFTGDLGSFSLSDSSPVNKTTTFANLMPGSYDVTESAVEGWDLTGLSCVDPDSGTSVNLGSATASIDLDDGEVVTCTFANTRRGTVTISKATNPASTAQSFDFGGDLGAFTLSGGASMNFNNVTPGSYDVTETVPGGWELVEIQCTDPDGGSDFALGTATATVDVDPGEHVSCTFTDVIPGTLTVIKDAEPDDPQDFDFESGMGPFTLDDPATDDTDGVPNSITFSALYPTDVNVTEVVPAGWTLAQIVCTDPTANTSVDVPSATASVTIDPGDDTVCTFVNTQQPGSITIVKDAQPDSGQAFGFTGSLGSFSLADDGASANSRTFTGMAAGTYNVTETVPAGWSLGGISCNDPDSGTTVNVGTATATIDLDAGENIACSFIDTEIPVEGGTITIIEEASPDDPLEFQFTGDLGSFVLSDGGPGSKSRSFPSLAAGAYSVSQILPPDPWVLEAIVCQDPDGGTTTAVPTATIDLDDGEVVTCSFFDLREERQLTGTIPALDEWALLLLAALVGLAGLAVAGGRFNA